MKIVSKHMNVPEEYLSAYMDRAFPPERGSSEARGGQGPGISLETRDF